MRLRRTGTQRLPTWRSSRQVSGPWGGLTAPRTANETPARARRLSVRRVMVGTTLTLTGNDSTCARAWSPAKTARTWPLAGSTTLVAQRPSGPALVVVTGVQAGPVVVNSTVSGTFAGDEPSAKRMKPDTGVGLMPFCEEALTVIALADTA